MNISEARLCEFRQVIPHPNAAYYSIFRVCPTIENDAISDVKEPPKEAHKCLVEILTDGVATGRDEYDEFTELINPRPKTAERSPSQVTMA